MPITKQQALDYHSGVRPGKIEVTPTKPCRTQRDLSLAYTPGVADACLAIHENPHDAFKYTARGNLVAVVSNGTAVLGLGDIGALAGKPVMEGDPFAPRPGKRSCSPRRSLCCRCRLANADLLFLFFRNGRPHACELGKRLSRQDS
jgi:hypothetical protein